MQVQNPLRQTVDQIPTLYADHPYTTRHSPLKTEIEA